MNYLAEFARRYREAHNRLWTPESPPAPKPPPALKAKAPPKLPRWCVEEARGRPQRAAVVRIGEFVAEFYSISWTEMLGQSRERKIARARLVAIYLAKTLTPLSNTFIARVLGRDQSTIATAGHRLEQWMRKDRELTDEVEEIKRRMGGGK
jgi:Bacterial dnaA protein helix-turn-helix